jgi:hypothetical protein
MLEIGFGVRRAQLHHHPKARCRSPRTHALDAHVTIANLRITCAQCPGPSPNFLDELFGREETSECNLWVHGASLDALDRAVLGRT